MRPRRVASQHDAACVLCNVLTNAVVAGADRRRRLDIRARIERGEVVVAVCRPCAYAAAGGSARLNPLEDFIVAMKSLADFLARDAKARAAVESARILGGRDAALSLARELQKTNGPETEVAEPPALS